MLYEKDEIIKDIHIGIPKDKVITKCLDILNTYGNKPSKFIIIIIINIRGIIEINPLIFDPKVREVCCDIIDLADKNKFSEGEGCKKKYWIIIIINNKDINQNKVFDKNAE